jgi:redox-sensitive bicupin YhaK (pirin superfamily)
MPAVTADTLALPRFARAPVESIVRPTRSVTTAPRGFEGEGFPVRRAFAGVGLADLDPFVHLDQMGEIEYAPGEPKGTPWHPHRGFETVTYMLDGAMQHQDSHGGGGLISDGATQWMTAGSGILHIETPPESLVVSGGLFHGFQLWVNLPSAHKMRPPAYQALEGADVTLVSSPDGGALLRVIAGDLPIAGTDDGADDALRGPGSTFTPITLIHATLAAGAEVELPWRADFNALVYALSGNGVAGRDRDPLRSGQLAVLGSGGVERGQTVLRVGADSDQESRTPAFDVLIMGGRPIREYVAMYGPFVMNTQAELRQAVEDYQAGRLGVIPENALMPHVIR